MQCFVDKYKKRCDFRIRRKTSKFIPLILNKPDAFVEAQFNFSVPFAILTHGFTDGFPGGNEILGKGKKKWDNARFDHYFEFICLKFSKSRLACSHIIDMGQIWSECVCHRLEEPIHIHKLF